MNKPRTKALLHRSVKSESPCLIVERGLQRGHAFPLPMPRGSLSLGRDPSCDLAFDPNVERMVSRRHAEIEVRADGVWIKDLGSANRTRLNDQLLQGEARLKDGDRLELGPEGPLILVRLPSSEEAPWVKAGPADDSAHLPPLHPEPRAVPRLEAPAPFSGPVARAAVGPTEERGAAPAVKASAAAKGGTVVMGSGAASAAEVERVPALASASASAPAPAPALAPASAPAHGFSDRASHGGSVGSGPDLSSKPTLLEVRVRGLLTSGLLAQGLTLLLLLSGAAGIGLWVGLSEPSKLSNEPKSPEPVLPP